MTQSARGAGHGSACRGQAGDAQRKALTQENAGKASQERNERLSASEEAARSKPWYCQPMAGHAICSARQK